MVKDNVRHALLHYDICHRSGEFEEMFADTQEKILKLFHGDDSYYSVIVSGSGTSANETVLSSIFKEGGGCSADPQRHVRRTAPGDHPKI